MERLSPYHSPSHQRYIGAAVSSPPSSLVLLRNEVGMYYPVTLEGEGVSEREVPNGGGEREVIHHDRLRMDVGVVPQKQLERLHMPTFGSPVER